MAYPLPLFVSRTLSNQPIAPRQVPIWLVVQAVLSGADCAIYAIGSLVLIGFGLAVAAHALPSRASSSDVPVGLAIVGVGVLCTLLPSFRVWQVVRALRQGDAHVADLIEAGVGPARIYGTPWGQPMGTRTRPILRWVRTGSPTQVRSLGTTCSNGGRPRCRRGHGSGFSGGAAGTFFTLQ